MAGDDRQIAEANLRRNCRDGPRPPRDPVKCVRSVIIGQATQAVRDILERAADYIFGPLRAKGGLQPGKGFWINPHGIAHWQMRNPGSDRAINAKRCGLFIHMTNLTRDGSQSVDEATRNRSKS